MRAFVKRGFELVNLHEESREEYFYGERNSWTVIFIRFAQAFVFWEVQLNYFFSLFL